MNKENKKKVIENFRQHEQDSGSIGVQIALLTNFINSLTEHARLHPKDYAAKLSMTKSVAQRRKSLRYLQHQNPEYYKLLIERLDLRK